MTGDVSEVCVLTLRDSGIVSAYCQGHPNAAEHERLARCYCIVEYRSTQFSCLACQCVGFQRVLSQVSYTDVRVSGAGAVQVMMQR